MRGECYLTGVMTPLGQGQRLDLHRLHRHQLSPRDSVACDGQLSQYRPLMGHDAGL